MLGWELPPHNSGGLGVACYQLCQTLSKNGVDIEFVLPYQAANNIDFMKITSALPTDVNEVIRMGGIYDSYKFMKEDGQVEWHDIVSHSSVYEKSVEKLVAFSEFDVIHAHDWLTFRAALRAKAIKNRPLILHVHSIEHDRAGGKYGNPYVHEIEYMSLQVADQIIAVSNHTKNAIMREYQIPPEKILVIHNSIDSCNLPVIDEANSFQYLEQLKAKGYKVITNVGRLTIQKGLYNLMQLAKQVINFEPKTMFLVVGSGDQYFELIELAAELGISKNVIFTGFLRGKQWRDAFTISDLFIMPSVSEPFGLTPLEAAGYGTASLVSKQSGVAEVFNNCLKADYWDINKMTDQIISFIKNPSLQKTLSTNSYNEFLGMSWQNAADELTSSYNKHINEMVAL